MNSIDVHDLLEDEAQVIAAFVEFLRQRHKQPQETRKTALPADAARPAPEFSVWPLGVKGTLSREEMYDYL